MELPGEPPDEPPGLPRRQAGRGDNARRQCAGTMRGDNARGQAPRLVPGACVRRVVYACLATSMSVISARMPCCLAT